MSCPNCETFQHLCKAGCCSYVPLEKELWERNRGKINAQPEEIFDMGNDIVLPITKSGNCPFLTQELSCAIYDERPEVCQLFGNETHLNLTCSYQKANGDVRNYNERMRIEKKQQKSVREKLKQ